MRQRPSIDCRDSADCAFVSGPCTHDAFHHDFGFLNGPLRGRGRRRHRRHARARRLRAARTARSTPAIRPTARGVDARRAAGAGDAGLRGLRSLQRRRRVRERSLRRGAQRLRAAARRPPEHLLAFSPVDGSIGWQDEIGASWGSIGAGGGLVVVGTLAASSSTSTTPRPACGSSRSPMPDDHDVGRRRSSTGRSTSATAPARRAAWRRSGCPSDARRRMSDARRPAYGSAAPSRKAPLGDASTVLLDGRQSAVAAVCRPHRQALTRAELVVDRDVDVGTRTRVRAGGSR